jgi:small subunit ribosomal protein S3
MGQKTNAIGMRLGINRSWDSVWYAGRDYADKLHQDLAIRRYMSEFTRSASISRIVIERLAKKVIVNIHTARPGVLIGKKGGDIDKMKKEIEKITGENAAINVVEIRKPEIDATLIAESIAQQIERRVSFRRAMKRSVQSAMRLGAEGIRINCSGRLAGSEIARMEWYREGRVPLHTLRADIDYGIARSNTVYGVIGIKVWVFKGEVLTVNAPKEQPAEKQQAA